MVVEGIISPICNLSRALFSFIFGFYFMCEINPILTLIIFPFAVFAGIITKISADKFKTYAKQNRIRYARMWRISQENLHAMRDIHSLNAEEISRKNVYEMSLEMSHNLTKTAKYSMKINLLNNFSFLIITCIMLLTGTFFINKGIMSIGAVISIVMYNTIITTPVQEIINSLQYMHLKKD